MALTAISCKPFFLETFFFQIYTITPQLPFNDTTNINSFNSCLLILIDLMWDFWQQELEIWDTIFKVDEQSTLWKFSVLRIKHISPALLFANVSWHDQVTHACSEHLKVKICPTNCWSFVLTSNTSKSYEEAKISIKRTYILFP